MQHIKPMGKGDALCPLGFHPQVRWPTRCKRCFRDYKEHGNRNKEQDNRLKKNDTTASSPSLSSWSSRTVENKNNDTVVTRSWTSTTNLNENNNQQPKCYETINSNKKTSSWTSTPDLVQSSDNSKNGGEHVASATLPRRKQLVVVNDRNSDDDYRRTSYTVRRRTNFMKQPSMELHVHENIPSAKTESVNFEQKISFCDTKEDTESDIFTDAVSSINTNETKTTVNDNFSQVFTQNLQRTPCTIKCNGFSFYST